MQINYNNKKFRALSNSDNGEIGSDLIFQYKQQNNILRCEYAGGEIIKGHLIGIVHENGNIDMRYHQINSKGEIKTGKCLSTPEILPNGKITLHEDWEWTCGDFSKGSSILEEI